MKNPLLKPNTLQNPGRGLILAAGLLLVAAKLVLCTSQQVFLWPNEAVLDDMLLYDGAVSITGGDWLGAYGWKTLSKHSFFSLWLAVLHWLHIPYLLGGQLLWAGAAAAAALAFAPLFKNNWLRLGLFAALLFSPSSTANPAPNGFVLRVYRDNIFPALCLLCIAGMAGAALRLHQQGRGRFGWPVLGGLAAAACWLCREDGWWMLFFMAGATLVCGWFTLRAQGGKRQKLLRCAALLLPFVLLAAGVLSWCAANYAAYGRFIVSDFSGGEFADAYGAMTRIEHENWDPKVDVPRDVRQKLYENVPAFAELEPQLESDNYLGRYAGEDGQDYTSGAFYWALREAAAEHGHYDTPQKAEAYFTGLAADINALCDSGTLAAGPRRSSVSPPLRAGYIGPVLAEGLYSLGFCAVYAQCSPRSLWSPQSNDPVFYADEIAPMEAFLYEKALTATQENSTAPYYTTWQKLCYLAFDIVRVLYAIATPLALLAALAWQVAEGRRLLKLLRQKQPAGTAGLTWLLMLGLLLCILLRAFMIAFVTVASFTIGTYVMYLASIHPLMILYGFIGTAKLLPSLLQRAAKRRAAKAAKTSNAGAA